MRIVNGWMQTPDGIVDVTMEPTTAGPDWGFVLMRPTQVTLVRTGETIQVDDGEIDVSLIKDVKIR